MYIHWLYLCIPRQKITKIICPVLAPASTLSKLLIFWVVAMASRLFSCLGRKHDSSCWTVHPCKSWISVTSWKTFLVACDSDVTRQSIPMYLQQTTSFFCCKSLTLSQLTFKKTILGVCDSKRLFCLSEDRLCKPLQFYNIRFDTKHASGILLTKGWHACYLISPTLSTFLMEFIYHPFIQSLEMGIHLEEEFLAVQILFYFLVSILFEMINHCDFFCVFLYFIITPFDSVIRKQGSLADL